MSNIHHRPEQIHLVHKTFTRQSLRQFGHYQSWPARQNKLKLKSKASKKSDTLFFSLFMAAHQWRESVGKAIACLKDENQKCEYFIIYPTEDKGLYREELKEKRSKGRNNRWYQCQEGCTSNLPCATFFFFFFLIHTPIPSRFTVVAVDKYCSRSRLKVKSGIRHETKVHIAYHGLPASISIEWSSVSSWQDQGVFCCCFFKSLS